MSVTLNTNLMKIKDPATGQYVDVHAFGAPGEVADWLDDHPEATTTVMDGSLTEEKFSNALKLATIKEYVTPQMFNAHGNGTDDDTTPVQNAIDYAAEHNLVLFFGNNKYLVSQINITEPLQSIDFTGCEFIASSSEVDAVVVVHAIRTEYKTHGYIKNLRIDANNLAPVGLLINGSRRRIFDSIYVTNPPDNGIGVRLLSGNGNNLSHIMGRAQQSDPIATNTTFIKVDVNDNYVTSCDYINYSVGLHTSGLAVVNDFHGFINNPSIYPDSCLIHIGGSGVYNNIYPDTHNYCFIVDNDAGATINNIICAFNRSLVGQEYTDENPPYFIKADSYFTRNMVINNVFFSNIIYAPEFMLTDTVAAGKCAISIDNINASVNSTYPLLKRIGYEASYKNIRCAYESAIRSDYPMMFNDGYSDKITISNSTAAADTTLCAFSESYKVLPTPGIYRGIRYNGSVYSDVYIKVYIDSNLYKVSCDTDLNVGDILYINHIPATFRSYKRI